jgi:UDP-glucose 4-epimerase
MKNVLIIGASGFIGQRVCLRLLEAGHTVTAADIRPPTSPTPTEHRITHVSIDVTKVTNFREVIKDFNVIIYLASTLLPQASNERPLYDIQSNLIPLVLLLEELRQTPDKRLIFASSGGTVYGEMTESILTEESPTMPLCSYGIVKLSSEKYISMYRKSFRFWTTSFASPRCNWRVHKSRKKCAANNNMGRRESHARLPLGGRRCGSFLLGMWL